MANKTEAEQVRSELSGWWASYCALVESGIIPVDAERERLNRIYNVRSVSILDAVDGTLEEGSMGYKEALAFSRALIKELAAAVGNASKKA